MRPGLIDARARYRHAARRLRNTAVEPDRSQMRIWRMRIACWVPKATNTHLLLFHSNNGCTNAPQCYVIRTLTVLCQITETNKTKFGTKL